MNKYWIHKNTGTKAIIYHIDAPDSPYSYLILHTDNTKSRCTRQCLDTYWIPITKAEYDSSLTLEEIKRNRNTDKDDKVNHPSHYTWLKDLCGIEVIDITRHLDFDCGNAVKYLLRAGHKEEKGYTNKDKAIEDLKKAIFYINDKIKMIQDDK